MVTSLWPRVFGPPCIILSASMLRADRFLPCDALARYRRLSIRLSVCTSERKKIDSLWWNIQQNAFIKPDQIFTKTSWKIECTNISAWFQDVFDVSDSLLQPAFNFKATSAITDSSISKRLPMFPTPVARSNLQQKSWLKVQDMRVQNLNLCESGQALCSLWNSKTTLSSKKRPPFWITV